MSDLATTAGEPVLPVWVVQLTSHGPPTSAETCSSAACLRDLWGHTRYGLQDRTWQARVVKMNRSRSGMDCEQQKPQV